MSFERQYISLTDLAKFFELMGLRKQTPTIHGPNVPEVPGGEATLDVQYVVLVCCAIVATRLRNCACTCLLTVFHFSIRYVMGVGAEVNTTVWSYPEGDYILNWAEQVRSIRCLLLPYAQSKLFPCGWQIADTEDPPLVTSISYGDTEIGYEQKSGYGLQYIYRMNGELIKVIAGSDASVGIV